MAFPTFVDAILTCPAPHPVGDRVLLGHGSGGKMSAALLKERRVVITGLQHLGVHVIESEHDRVGERLVQGYLDLKRRNLL